MAGLLEELVTYITSLGLVEGDGRDTFRDFMPEKPDNIVILYEYAGDPNNYYTESVHRSIQVRVRNTSADASRSLAANLYKAFAPEQENGRIDFTPNTWGQVHRRGTPLKIDQDGQDRVHYVFNLGITTTNEE